MGRFSEHRVEAKEAIRPFILSLGLQFQKGCAFYELTKKEKNIQASKRIVVKRRSDGTYISGEGVRRALGLPMGSDAKNFDLTDEHLRDFSVFVESTSVNRALVPDTLVLYDEDPSAPMPATFAASSPSSSSSSSSSSKAGKAVKAEPVESAGKKRGRAAATPTPAPAPAPRRGRAAVKAEEEEEEEEEEVKPTPAKGRGRAAAVKKVAEPPAKRSRRTVEKEEEKEEEEEEERAPSPVKGRGCRGPRGKATTKKAAAVPDVKEEDTKMEDLCEKDVDMKEETKTEEKAPLSPTPAPAPAPAPAPVACSSSSSSSGASSLRRSGEVASSVEVVICWDTTGSMYPALTQVRRTVDSFVKKLLCDVKGVKIALMCHGDYKTICPYDAYDVTFLDFTTDERKLCDWVRDVKNTGGADFPECYEYAMQVARTKLSWTKSSSVHKALVMIGDAPPHTKAESPYGIDWKDEARLLMEEHIRVYAVKAMDYPCSFWQDLAHLTNGFFLKLDQFHAVPTFLTAIFFNESSVDLVEKYEEDLKSEGKVDRNLHNLFDTLLGRKTTFVAPVNKGGASIAFEGLEPVPPSRFQILEVDHDMAIKQFVEDQSLTFKQGRGFYQLTKKELIQHHKEVIVYRRSTGDFWCGSNARKMLGLGSANENVNPPSDPDLIFFVQSTSYNRKLIGGTKFLYEVDLEA